MLPAIAELTQGMWQGRALVLIKGPSLDPFYAFGDQDVKHDRPSATAVVRIICTTGNLVM
jgi:hypothetical protein